MSSDASLHSPDNSSIPVSGNPSAWCDILLRDGESSSQEVIQALRLFVQRAVRRGMKGRREQDAAFIEDISQEATLRILQNLHTFRRDSQFTTWATTVALRVAFTELRRSRWKDVSLDQLLGGEQSKSGGKFEPASTTETVERSAEREELVSSLRLVMKQELSERQMVAITAELNGIPLHQLAEKLQTNPNALYKLLHDARKKLKTGLEKMGITDKDVRLTMAM